MVLLGEDPARGISLKLLVLNANTTQAVTERALDAVRRRGPDDVELVGATAPFGEPYVVTRPAAVVAAHAALVAVRAAVAQERDAGRAPFDACLYACFGEPGLEAIRGENAFPVVGMAEGSIATALQMGARFSIVVPDGEWPAMLREQLTRSGLESRCAGFGMVPGDALALSAKHEDGAWVVGRVVEETIAAQAPDVLIIGGSALAGYAAEIERLSAIPVLDSLAASYEQTLALARIARARPA